MNSKEIIDYLKSEASEKYKENVIKMGIPEKFCIGVSTSTLRKFAKKLDKSNELAFELWNTHYHEARLLAVLIFDYGLKLLKIRIAGRKSLRRSCKAMDFHFQFLF